MMQTPFGKRRAKHFSRPGIRLAFAAMAGCLGMAATAIAQEEQFNYDESKVKSRTRCPIRLIMQDGRPVTSAVMWRGERRGEILRSVRVASLWSTPERFDRHALPCNRESARS